MKLYTEEQVRLMFEDISRYCMTKEMKDYWDVNSTKFYKQRDLFINLQFKKNTPIELPSDEEIGKYVDSIPYYGHCTTEFKEGIEQGAKWVIEQIKQQ